MVSRASRTLLRRLRSLVWVTLEEVALDAVVDDGRLVSYTSARLVAERLGVEPTSAAGALADLRRRGLLVSEPRQVGRFELAAYALRPVAGVVVLPPGAPETRPISGGLDVGSASS